MKLNSVPYFLISALVLAGCASEMKKAAIDPSANPANEIARLESNLQGAYARQVDVLDRKDYNRASQYLGEAKSDLAKGKKQQDVLDDVAYGEAYLDAANSAADSRRAQIPAVLAARQNALDAGARNGGPTMKTLGKLDDELVSKSEKYGKLKPEEISGWQNAYLNLELSAIENRELGNARAKIEAAQDQKAEKYAPRAFAKAKTDYATAENQLRANRHVASSYRNAVAQANASADLLAATLAATKKGTVDENTAAQLVAQNQQITNLHSSLNQANTDLDKTKTELEGQINDQKAALADQSGRLKKANAAVSLQESIDQARREFSSDEAEVFQQGDKLVIRLKTVEFPSGRAELPRQAIPVLAKVRDVAAGLKPSSVVVEGHTDSTGSRVANQKLSQARAGAVEKYFEDNGLGEAKLEAVGYGFDKPIASNKTREGRRQNRRVDVIVTPETAAE